MVIERWISLQEQKQEKQEEQEEQEKQEKQEQQKKDQGERKIVAIQIHIDEFQIPIDRITVMKRKKQFFTDLSTVCSLDSKSEFRIMMLTGTQYHTVIQLGTSSSYPIVEGFLPLLRNTDAMSLFQNVCINQKVAPYINFEFSLALRQCLLDLGDVPRALQFMFEECKNRYDKGHHSLTDNEIEAIYSAVTRKMMESYQSLTNDLSDDVARQVMAYVLLSKGVEYGAEISDRIDSHKPKWTWAKLEERGLVSMRPNVDRSCNTIFVWKW